MSDEIPGGTVIDPDEQPAPAIAQTPLSVAGEPAPETPPETPDEDENLDDVPQIDLREGKFVPVSALVADRKKAKEALKAAKAEAESFKARAAKADEIEKYVEDAKPYIEALRQRPDLLKQAQSQPPPPPEQPILSPQAAEEYARTLELYTPDGKPDVARAQKVGGFIKEAAREIAQQTVSPLVQSEAQRASVAQFQRVMTAQDADGNQVDPKVLLEVWRAVPPELSAQPQVADHLLDTAWGRQRRMSKSPPKPPATAPLVTEPSGGRAPVTRPLSDVEAKVARSRGLTDKQWQTTRDTYRPGQPNILE